jgi:hypothetical protein
MYLHHGNYFSQEASKEFLSASQYKDFYGSLGLTGCEAMAMARINGEWGNDPTPAMIMSSYVDAHFSGTLDTFRAKNWETISRQDGETKATFKHAEVIINRIEASEYFMQYMAGEKQVIMTGEFFGTKWKIAIDSLLRDVLICDLKVMKSLRDAHWVKDYGYMSFVPYYGYDIQAAIYQKVVEINTGKRLPFFIAGASKEKYPDIDIIGIDNATIDRALMEIEKNIPRILKLKAGELQPDRCGQCDYCRSTKELTGPIHFSDLILKI